MALRTEDASSSATSEKRLSVRALARIFSFSAPLVCGCAYDTVDLSARYADVVVSAPSATGEGFGDAHRAVNGVRGGGTSEGSLDVYSLDGGERTQLVLGWRGALVMDGPGTDFVVFENAFQTAGGATHFMDPVIVSVSHDGETFVDMPHAYRAPDPRRYSADPTHWEGFAGRTPVLFHEEENVVDPFDPELAGGDAFDLAALPDSDEGDRIREEGIRFVRLVSAATVINPETGEHYPSDPVANGADIDGVYARWLAPANSR